MTSRNTSSNGHGPETNIEVTELSISQEPAGNKKNGEGGDANNNNNPLVPSSDGYSSGRSILNEDDEASYRKRVSHWRTHSKDEGIRLGIYDVSCKLGKKVTLDSVTGVIEPGEFYGCMGPSGAGKTMLLDIICFRKSVGKVKGAVLYNGSLPTTDFVQHNVAYVEQNITIQASFTVEEAIIYSAMLKRSREYFSKSDIDSTVDHVIDQLGLQKIRKLRIGNSRLVRGISGGEARRVSIGISLVQLTKPGLLCLDEPTTGLDSAIGNDILKLVRGCSDEGWTIFTTIHNPSSMMMDHMDGIVLLVASKVIWFGPYDLESLKSDFEAHGIATCPKTTHIVEYIIQVVGGGSRGADEGTLSRACAAYRASKVCSDNHERAVDYAKNARIDLISGDWRPPKKPLKSPDPLYSAQSKERHFANTIPQEIAILLKFRTWTQLKDPNFVLTRLAIFVLQSLVFATFWANRQKNISGLIDTIAVMFALPISLSIPFGLFIPDLFSQRSAFIREQHEGCYRTISYCVTVIITELTLVGIGSLLYSLIMYFALGTFPLTVSAFFFFFLNAWIISMNSVIFAQFATNVSRTMEIAMLVAPCYWLWNALVMGFITQHKNMEPWYAWTYFISYLQYGFTGAMLNQFQGQKWEMCAELQADDFSLQEILNEITNGEVTDMTRNLLGKLQYTVQNATDFQFPFQLNQAYCSATNQTDVSLPDFITDYLPDQTMLTTIANLLPAFLDAPNGKPKPSCHDLCLPVPGSELLDMYGINADQSKWGYLGFGILFIVVHSLLMYVAMRHAKYFEKR
jgi:ATP-binding cassette subfamily G (WHITE) protein 1/ATP-binding cassette subfamily G (WHITE) protein 2